MDTADTSQRVYRYSIERTNLPIRDCSAEFRAEPIDAHASRIVWEARFTLEDEDDRRTVEAIRYFLHEGATSIQAKYPPYAEREPNGVETGIADADKQARAGTVNEPSGTLRRPAPGMNHVRLALPCGGYHGQDDVDDTGQRLGPVRPAQGALCHSNQ